MGECIFCGSKKELTVEHLLPRSRHGPDIPDNAVWVCKSCNSAKGDRRLYEFYGLENRYKIPRIAEGKYLKLIYDLLEKKGLLDTRDVRQLCPICDLPRKCPVKEKMTVYCLEGTFKK